MSDTTVGLNRLSRDIDPTFIESRYLSEWQDSVIQVPLGAMGYGVLGETEIAQANFKDSAPFLNYLFLGHMCVARLNQNDGKYGDVSFLPLGDDMNSLLVWMSAPWTGLQDSQINLQRPLITRADNIVVESNGHYYCGGIARGARLLIPVLEFDSQHRWQVIPQQGSGVVPAQVIERIDSVPMTVSLLERVRWVVNAVKQLSAEVRK